MRATQNHRPKTRLIFLFAVILFLTVMIHRVLSQTAMPNPVCYGCPINLFCDLPECNMAGSTYYWFNGSWSSTMKDPVIYPGMPEYTTGTFTLIVTPASGPAIGAAVTVIVLPQMSLSMNIIPGTTMPCQPSCIDLTVSDGCAPFTFQWNNGLTSEDNCTPICGINTVTVQDQCDTKTATLVFSDPILTANVKASSSGCCDGEINLTVSCGMAPYTFLWSTGATTEDITNLCTGDYCVTVIDAGGHVKSCCWGVAKKKSTCQSTYLENITVSNGITSCYDAVETIYAAVNGTTFIVQNGGTANLIAGHNIRLQPGSRVNPGGKLYGYITTNGQYCSNKNSDGGSNAEGTGNDTLTLANSTAGQHFKVFPNPTSGSFTIELNEMTSFLQATVEIYAMRGEKVITAEMRGEQTDEFSLSERPSGLYFIRVVNGDRIMTGKIIKQ
jgi:hypothetical protein